MRANNSITILILYIVLIGIFTAKYVPMIPNNIGNVSIDYSIFMPDLLAGYYWVLHNGYWSIPWFSPAECGGVPFFADPQVGYFSVPQLLTLWVPPLLAIQAMFLLFASVGFFGAYTLSRVSFRSSVPAALLAASLFLFNGFYACRILVGHMTFHSFMLLPVVAAALLQPPGGGRTSLPLSILRLGTASACFAYMVQAGSFVILLPMLLSLLVVMLIHMLRFSWRSFPLARLAGSGVFGLLLAAGKLTASLALIAQFPRDNYPLPGIASLLSDIRLAFMTVFFWVPVGASHAVTNSMWRLEPHEWEYGVSPIPLLLMLTAACRALRRGVAHGTTPSQMLLLVALVVLLAVPVALNWYQPGWNAFLKSLPLIGDNSNLVRWFCVYILPAVIGGALALDTICGSSQQLARLSDAMAAGCIAAVTVFTLARNVSAYAPQGAGGYQVAGIEAAYRQAAATDVVPPVTDIVVQMDATGHIVTTPQRDDALTQGYSQLLCYQPLFGYRLEWFPLAPLHPGPALEQNGHVLNVKDPACYLFPAENRCRPGDQFDVLERDQAAEFLDYRPYPFVLPAYASAANCVSGIAFLLLIGASILASGMLSVRWMRDIAAARASEHN